MTTGLRTVEQLAAALGQPPPTPAQQAVVAAPLEPLGVVAGAGSGKTATMATRVVWLVATGAVRAESVLGLTFTRKAAAELSSRVRRQLGRLVAARLLDPVDLGEPTISTYHSYAARLVADFALLEGREPGARLVPPAVCWQLVTRVVAAYDGPMDAVPQQPPWVADAVLALAGELAEHLRTPAELAAEVDRWERAVAGRARRSACASELRATLTAARQLLPLVAGFAAEKAALDVLDHGDQVALAADIARRHPEVGRLQRSRFGVVLLDEYQDTGYAQRELLRALFGGGHPVTAVGDPCQSIYGWRGASAGGLRRFGEHFPLADGTPAPVHHLATSFRNGEHVLAVANRLAAPLRSADPAVPVLTAAPGRRGAARVVVGLFDTVAAEADWVGEQVAAALAAPAGAVRAERAVSPSDVAVLCRKRSQFAALRAALDRRQVPVEVVGLGGLLSVPEVLDVVSALRALDDPTANAAVVRLLTGPGLRVGPRDLVALGRRARTLLRRPDSDRADGSPVASAEPGLRLGDDTDVGSLVEALEDLGPESDYSPVGYRRLADLAQRLRRLRRRAGVPLPDLVADTVATLGLDVEVASRPGVSAAAARADLDAFLDVAIEFAAQDEQPSLRAFLGYLQAAEQEEFGLEPGRVGATDTVKILTVHAAKGLEWPVVAVPGLAAGSHAQIFPARGATSPRWTATAARLPFPLRGDAADLPRLAGLDKAAGDAFEAACRQREELEERRLGYVAVTRAADLLLCSGYWWGTAKHPLGPSAFLAEARAAAESGAGHVATWSPAPPADLPNPLLAVPQATRWPQPPGGPLVAAVRDGAELVLAALSGSEPAPAAAADSARAAGWAQATRLLLAERAAQRRPVQDVPLPAQLTTTTLVRLASDPAALARSLVRPVPRAPAPTARRGTAFHAWLESRFGQLPLLDIDELAGADDDTAAPDDDLALLQERFRASHWFDRTPVAVEVPFEMPLGGLAVRGRIDAVYTDADGGVTVVDWKTGRRPDPADAAAAAVQLAVYRLAWSRLTGRPLDRVRAAFHYVRDDVTVRPVDLLEEPGLLALVEQLPVSSPDVTC